MPRFCRISALAVPRRRLLRCRYRLVDAAPLREIRRDLRRALAAGGLSEPEIATAELVLGELTGNVVRHAPGEAEVVLDLGRAAAVLHVRDTGPGFAGSSALPADEWCESGRGLAIVAHLADRLTITPRPGGGTAVRVVLARHFSRTSPDRDGST